MRDLSREREMFEETRDNCFGDDDTAKLIARPRIRAMIWDKTKGRCWYCGKEMNPFREFCIDHVHPQGRGGGDSYGNLVPACRHCNNRKGGDSDLEHLRSMLGGDGGDLARAGGVSFTPEQMLYLQDMGVDIDLLAFPRYIFYFETLDGTDGE
jgi:hypothetical protein